MLAKVHRRSVTMGGTFERGGEHSGGWWMMRAGEVGERGKKGQEGRVRRDRRQKGNRGPLREGGWRGE